MLLAASATAQESEVPGQSDDRAARWSRFPVLVWFHGGPAPSPAAFAVLRRYGLAGRNIEASSESNAAAAAGIDFYVDHLAGKGDLFLRPEVFDADRKKQKADLAGFQPLRPSCLSDPELLARLGQLVDAGVARHARNRPLGYVLDDELSITRGVNPMDYCFGEKSLAAFRAWLEQRYGTIDPLNLAWKQKLTAFEEAVPPTTEAVRRANAGRGFEAVDFAAWNDHREFMDAALAGCLGELADRARRLDPATPVGFTGGQFPSAFGGFDWWLLMQKQTFVEAYESGAAQELVHAFKRPEARVVSTLFVPDEEAERARWSPWELLERAARGDDGVVVWSSGAIFEAEGADLNAAGRRLAEAVAAVRKSKELLAGAAPVPPQALIWVSQPSVRAAWMLDSWQDGKTWANRLTSYEAAHSSSVGSREAWAALFQALSIPYGYVDARDFVAGRWPKEAARMIVLDEAVALSNAEIAALGGFLEHGGRLVADAHAGLFTDRLGAPHKPFQIDSLFGLARAIEIPLAEIADGFADGARGTEPFGLARGEERPFGAAEDVRRIDLGYERDCKKGVSLYLDLRTAGLVRGSGHDRRLGKFATAFGAWLAAHGIAAAAPRLPIALAGRAALHRFRGTEGDLLLAVPTVAPGDSFDVSLELGPKQEAVLLLESPWSRIWRLRTVP